MINLTSNRYSFFLFISLMTIFWGIGCIKNALPVPRSGLGHAQGTLFYKSQPKEGLYVYLYRIDDGLLDKETSVTTDKNGKWLALNIRPGKYIVDVRSHVPCSVPRFFSIEKKRIHDVSVGTLNNFPKEDLDYEIEEAPAPLPAPPKPPEYQKRIEIK